jgi:hypothetical protein
MLTFRMPFCSPGHTSFFPAETNAHSCAGDYITLILVIASVLVYA